MGDAIQPNDLTLEPPPSTWASLMRTPPADETSRRFREQLGLPTDRPIVMSGHQVQLWHPGILSKLLAANALAERTGAAVAWMLVDHESHRPATTRLPVLDASDRLRAHTWAIDTNDQSGALDQPTFRPQKPDLPAGWSLAPGVEATTAKIHEATATHTGARDKAGQMTSALFDLLEPHATRPIVVRVSDVSRTDLFSAIIERVGRDPRAFCAMYNDAIAHHPNAEMRPLRTDANLGVELPIWRRDGSTNAPLFERELGDTPIERLIPRALLSTGLMRHAGCDLFIHGTGGRHYEPINDRWLAPWLESPLAPFTIASADLRLDLEGPIVTETEAERARWRAHHAAHHPRLLDADDAQAARDALVAQIAAAPRYSPERRALFNRLHELLDEQRAAHADTLRALEGRAAELTRAAGERSIREDRTWAAVLHRPESLRALRHAVERAFDE